MASGPDWRRWHDPYDDPASPLSRRLVVVQRLIAEALDASPPGPLRAVSMCAGQGRDLIGVLAAHPRRDDVEARLVELDPVNAADARSRARATGLRRLDVVTADASISDVYAGAVPADVVLACGIFGNISDGDVEGTVRALPSLCAPGATVIWTRHRGEPDLTPAIRRWFSEAGFDEVAFVGPSDVLFGVGAHRLVGRPVPLRPGQRYFTFVPGS